MENEVLILKLYLNIKRKGQQIIKTSLAVGRSFLAHASDIDDLLEGLNGVLEDWLDGLDRKSTRLNSSHSQQSRMPSSA